MMARRKARVAILISGRGSNMKSLVEAAASDGFAADIAGVVSDRADAPGLDLARSLGVAAFAVARSDHANKAAHEAALDEKLRALDAEFVCLAGYMRLLSPAFVQRWEGRILNIHPSLLPLFKGLDTHRRALEAGMRIHGCTVHFVTAEMDGGPILAQAAVPVASDDTEQALTRRVLAAEHRLYRLALDAVASGRARLVRGRVVWSEEEVDASAMLSVPEPVPDTRSLASDLEELARITP